MRVHLELAVLGQPLERLALEFELLINGQTAKALGVTIPPLLLARAEHAID